VAFAIALARGKSFIWGDGAGEELEVRETSIELEGKGRIAAGDIMIYYYALSYRAGPFFRVCFSLHLMALMHVKEKVEA